MSVFILEVLGLYKRNKKKLTLDKTRDFLQFGRLNSTGGSTLNTGSSYMPGMEPFIIKWADFRCDLLKGVVIQDEDSVATVGVFPIYKTISGTCANQNVTIKDSVLSYVGDTVTVKTTEKFTANYIKLGASLEAGGSTGTANQVLSINASGAPVWVNNPASGGPTGSGTPNQMVMWTAAAAIGNATPVVMVQSGSGATAQLTIGTESDQTVEFETTINLQAGVKDRVSSLGTSGMFLQTTGSEVQWASGPVYNIETTTAGANVNLRLTGQNPASTDNVEFIAGSNITLTQSAGNTLTINSTASGSGSVTSVAASTAGDALDVGGSPITSNGTLAFTWAGGVTQYVNGLGNLITFPTLTSGTVTAVDSSSAVSALTLETSDGTTTPSLELDVTGGTAGQFLRQDGNWATIPGGNVGTVTSVSSSTTGNALDVTVTTATSTPALAFTFAGATSQYINGQGNLITFPADAGGTVTSVATTHEGDAFSVSIGGVATVNPSVDIELEGNALQYINGLGNLITFPTLTAGTVTSVAALTLGTAGTDLTSTVATGTTTPVITLNVPTASATNRGALSSADWTKFNNNTSATGTVTLVAATFAGTAFTSTVTNASTTPAIAITANGATTDYINGVGDFIAFPTIGAGTVTSVTAGTGMTQTGTATINPTLNVIGGDGIDATADEITVDITVVRTTGAQTIDGTKTFVRAVTCNSTFTGTNFILSSDKRLKENIKELEPDTIDVDWKSFTMKDSDEGYRVGVIAQELELDHPEFVETNDEGFKSVKYIDLLIAKIAELEARLENAGL